MVGFQPKWVEPNRKLLLNLKLICLDQKLPYSFDHKSNSSAVEDFPSSPHIDTFYSDDTRICKKHIIHTGYSFHHSFQVFRSALGFWSNGTFSRLPGLTGLQNVGQSPWQSTCVQTLLVDSIVQSSNTRACHSSMHETVYASVLN